jgi:ankyrin repeat protein
MHKTGAAKLMKLIEERVDPNKIQNGKGKRPAFVAANLGDMNILKALLEARADANLTEKKENGLTPAHEAAANDHVDALRLLLEARANIDARGDNGITPIHQAAFSNRVASIKVLLEARADVNTPTTNGKTPIYSATQEGHVKALKELLEARADANLTLRWSPIHVAAQYENMVALRLLLEARANLDASNHEGVTPIHVASKHGCLASVKFLLEAWADPKRVSIGGAGPLDYAKHGGNKEIIKLLEEVEEKDWDVVALATNATAQTDDQTGSKGARDEFATLLTKATPVKMNIHRPGSLYEKEEKEAKQHRPGSLYEKEEVNNGTFTFNPWWVVSLAICRFIATEQQCM